MKMYTRLSLLLGALTVAAALASPASALAEPISEWTHNGDPLESSETVHLEGEVAWQNEYGRIGCNADGSVTLSPGRNGKMTSLQLTHCRSEGELKELSSCEPLGVSSIGLPWGLRDEGAEGVDLFRPAFVANMNEDCLLGEAIYFETGAMPFVVLTADNPEDVADFSIPGEEVNFESNFGPVHMSASLQPTPGYGIVEIPISNETTGPYWTEEGSPIASTKHLVMSGQMSFPNEWAGFECSKVELAATMYPDGAGSDITAASFNGCQMTGWLHSGGGCELESVEASSLPVELEEFSVGNTGVAQLEFSANVGGVNGGAQCPVGGTDNGTIELYLQADNASAISSFSPSGEGSWPMGVLEVESSTGLSVSPVGTFGIDG